VKDLFCVKQGQCVLLRNRMLDSFGIFDPAREDISAYLNRLGQFFEMKDIVEPVVAQGADAAAQAAPVVATARYNRLRRAWLIRVIGANAYRLLLDTCSPEAPEVKSYEDLTLILELHYAPQRNKNSQRGTFADRKQQSGESISDFALALRNLAKYCEFGALLDSMLQSQFINGIRDLRIKSSMGLPTLQHWWKTHLNTSEICRRFSLPKFTG